MAVLLIDAFSVVILNLALPGSSFDYDTSWNSFDCDIHWKYFSLWNFLAVLWIVILPCNTFIVVLPGSTLVILSGSPLFLTLPGSTYRLLILVFSGSFVNWNARLQSFLLLYSLAVILFVILPSIPFNCGIPSQSF